jgi:Lsr2
MAQKVQVLLVDDLDGGEAAETVSFSLDGTAYEIDLSSDNASKLRKDFAQYIDHARKGGGGGRRRGRARTGPGRERSAEIRAWARQRGHKVSERGRIPATIISEYEASH